MSGILGAAASALGWSTQPSDDVSIVSGGLKITGWQRVLIHLGIEEMPASFELEATEWSPADAAQITVREGDPCTISIGTDVVITGYVVTVLREVEAHSHSVKITGASKSIDLVECSAIFNTFQLSNTNPLSLARLLCKPFGLRAVALGEIGDLAIQQFDVILTETPFEIIERVARSAALLVYDDTNGNILLSRAGATLAWSGFTEGKNVERYACRFSMDGRYSEISAVMQTTDTLFLSPDTADLGGQVALVTAAGPLSDPGVKRYRPLIIPAEMGDAGYKVAKQRVQWEINRRWGRGYSAEITCDSWRDGKGVLWGINTLAPLSLPGGKCTPSDPWLIGEVTFRRDEQGTHADVVLMPPQAFQPQPILLNPLASAVGQAEREQAGASPRGATITTEDLPPAGGP